ncbi:hypothetical protein [Geminicoccus flavidas]|uniref:hypothetical protein n=1 Tax=Geminicoccus flavidas TaxID=2506407 RepID=UPI001358577C|nr:hypothetical protein [Geminicoccus flavidas]
MQTQTRADDEQTFNRFLIVALQEDQQGLRTELSNLAASMLRLALDGGAAIEDFEAPWTQTALGLYGQRTGERMLQRTMENAGIMGTGR